MADHNDNILRASVKALEHAVLPAVDPTDPLATEQLRLTVGFLKFMQARIDWVYLRQVFEFDQSLALAQALREDAAALSGEVSARLESAVAAAHRTRQAAVPLPGDLRSAAAELSACASAVARLSRDGEPGRRQRVEREILRRSKPWVDMQRAWFLPMGFELRPKELPDLGQVLSSTSPPSPTHRTE